MAQHTSLKAEPRQRSGSSAINRMRKEGFVPAVIYGRKFDNANLKINRKAISDLLRASASDNILVDLEIDGVSGKQLALIQDVQHDYVKGTIVHVDFRAVKEDDQISAQVPVILLGIAAGVKNGGVLEHQVKSLTVQCASRDLPESISLDIENLDIGETAHVSDLQIPDGVTAALDGGVVVAMVQESRVSKLSAEEEAAEAAEGETSAEADQASSGDDAS
jgi:large subunit ribosomal protein L25